MFATFHNQSPLITMVIFTRSMTLKIRVEEKVIVIPSDIDIDKLSENG